ncbi:MAG: lipase family protein [Gammaproteobacteria bacterium]|jgi:hypothetical protein
MHFTSVGPTTLTDPTRAVTDEQRELAALSLIARTGEALEESDAEAGEILIGCIEMELDRQRVVSGKYQLVWGPATFKFPESLYDDNMMYVVARTASPSELVVVIRGTNAVALDNWLREDFAVSSQVDWPYQHGPLVPKLSHGTHVGLTALQTITARSALSGQPLSVREFLSERIGQGSLSAITVVGHSLGGALASALGLWLKETEAAWGGAGVPISVTTLAAATPGDTVFADYYERILGAATDRLFNPYDIVPLAWNPDTMRTIPGLYANGGIKANWLEELLISSAIRSVSGMDYRQILRSAPSLAGAIQPSERSFLAQAGWQHRCGYECAMGFELETVSRDCKVFPQGIDCSCPGR